MNKWEKVKIGDFLFERKGRYKPNDKFINGLKRIEKIDFSGNFYIVEKPSKTDMILVKSGDLVISGINVSKGAMGIYEGKEDVAATIHYSSYTFDETCINLEYFKRFLKSPEFLKLLQEQVKGGIKTEIKPKHILPLEINLPNIEIQNNLVKHFESNEININNLSTEITQQQTLLKKLRQAILQEAIQGKLTADWHKENPHIEPASELLKRIQAEKEQLIAEKKIKPQKPLPPIKDEEMPFELPEGWVWCRLGDISNYGQVKKIEPKYIGENTWVLELEDIEKLTSRILQTKNFSERKSKSTKNVFDKNDLLYGKLRPYLDKVIIAEKSGVCSTEIIPIKSYIDSFYLRLSMKNRYFIDYTNRVISGMRMPRLRTEDGRKALIPLPPLPEQKAIVAKVEKLLAYCDELEQQITQSKTYSEQLMQAVLKEAFEGK